MYKRQPELVDVVRIWDGAPHCAFTDLARFEGRWYCAFREGERHVYGADGRIRVLASDDGRAWRPAALLAEEGVDLRDPKLSVTADGRLMVVAGGSVYDGRTLVTRRPRVAFSLDGAGFGPLQPVVEEGEWLWRVTWHLGRAWGVAYDAGREPWALRLVVSDDGIDYRSVTELEVPGRPNETTLRFLPDGELMALVRREGDDRQAWIGTSRAPHTEWRWRPAGRHIGGPNFLALPGGALWAAGREYGEETRTALGPIDGDGGYEPLLVLPSGGDTSYPGLVFRDGLLWVSYYSSHEGEASIYLARVRLPGAPR